MRYDDMGYPSGVRCIAHRTEHGIDLRCTRPHKHKGNHRWAVDRDFYPFGRLDPDNRLDQVIVEAWNRGANRANRR